MNQNKEQGRESKLGYHRADVIKTWRFTETYTLNRSVTAYSSDKTDYVNSPDLAESPLGRDWAEIGSPLAVVGLDWPP